MASGAGGGRGGSQAEGNPRSTPGLPPPVRSGAGGARAGAAGGGDRDRKIGQLSSGRGGLAATLRARAERAQLSARRGARAAQGCEGEEDWVGGSVRGQAPEGFFAKGGGLTHSTYVVQEIQKYKPDRS